MVTAFPKPNAANPETYSSYFQTDPKAYCQKVLRLVDPHAKIHATTGILPTKTIDIPGDQYAALLETLEVPFLMTPILKEASRLTMPLPKETGYTWSWVTETKEEQKITWNVNPVATPPFGQAIAGYTPQTLQEGWLRFNPNLLSFELVNQQGQPIAEASVPNTLVLNMTNNKDAPITIPPGQLTQEGNTHTGTVFYIHFGRLASDEDMAKINIQAENWTFKCLSDPQYGHYWAATPTQSVSLANNKIIAFTLSNLITADRQGEVQKTMTQESFLSPLTFELINNDTKDNTIYIGSDTTNKLTLKITAHEDVKFLPNEKPVPVSEAATATGSILYLDLSQLQISEEAFNKIVCQAHNWQYALYASDNMICLIPTQEQQPEEDNSIDIALDNLTIATPPAASANLNIQYYHVPPAT